MTDTITIDGVTLTTEEAREVLAWVEEPWSFCAYVDNGHICAGGDGPRGHRGRVRMTPDLIEQLRDHCFPWREVRRDEVKPGEVFMKNGERFTAIGNAHDLFDDGDGLPHMDEHRELDGWRPTTTVLVRRPREVGTWLRDVEPGTLVEVVTTGVRRRVLEDPRYDGSGHVAALNETTGIVGKWDADTLVRIVEGES